LARSGSQHDASRFDKLLDAISIVDDRGFDAISAGTPPIDQCLSRVG
jgi:hypothetical protein